MEEEENRCEAMLRKFDRARRMFRPEDVDVHVMHGDKYEDKIANIEALCDDLVDKMELLTIKHRMQLGETKVTQWKTNIAQVESITREYVRSIRVKATELRGSSSTPAPSTPRSVETNDGEHNSSEQVRKAQVKVATSVEAIREDVLSLGADINHVADWGMADNHEVSRGIRQIDGWKKKVDKLVDKEREVKELTMLHNLDPSLHATAKSLVSTLKADLDTAVSSLEHEDGAAGRCLFTEDTNKAASVKLPRFNGDPGQDFARFQKEMEKALRLNRVTRTDQVHKLRESLSGHARQLVPETMEDIAEAWVVLHTAFGDPARVMRARKEKIAGLGPYPPNGRSSPSIKKQVEFLMSLELALKDIVDLEPECRYGPGGFLGLDSVQDPNHVPLGHPG